MFLQKLLKKLASLDLRETARRLLFNNFKEIIIIIGAGWLIIILIILFIIIGVNSNKRNKNDIAQNKEKDKDITVKTEQELVNYYDFVLPELNTFDLTYDYIEFRPKKYYTLPKPDILKNDYKIIMDNAVNDSLKFNFEKRKSKNE